MKTCEFRVDVFYPPEYRAKFYDILDKEKNKGNLSYKFRLEEAAPPPELIKDAVIIIASSLTIIKILYDFYNEIRKKKGKREYLSNQKTRDLMAKLNVFFESTVDIPRIKVGKRQTVETLFSEEALLFARFLRDERKTWIPRIATLPKCT